MAITDAVIQYRRSLKRRNCSANTVKNYMHTLRQFVLWVNIPIEHVKGRKILGYIDHLRARRLQPKTINCHLDLSLIHISEPTRQLMSSRMPSSA